MTRANGAIKQLTESAIISIMREEWQKRMLRLEGVLTATVKAPGGAKKPVLGKGTKVKHKGSGLRYDVSAVMLDGDGADESVLGQVEEGASPDRAHGSITLLSPEGEEFEVSSDEADEEYEVA